MCKIRVLISVLFAVLALSAVLFAGNWQLIGPEGGDVRSLAYDPGNPDRVLLGTSAGQLFQSLDAGRSWTAYAHLGPADEYVLDHIVFDPTHPAILYVAGWSLFSSQEGDVFRSDDGGRSWNSLSGIHGKSVRSLAVALSNHNELIAGALDGVYRSRDAGVTWERISPEGDPDLKNIVSLAIDPHNPDVVYAGTFHLPWKTEDGGRNWHRINQGVLDDSDVFSIIIDPSMAGTVYASACSGIYKSTNGGEWFARIKGIPHSAIRTRVLRQDPKRPLIVYAGTTSGLWKTFDGGVKWELYSAPDVVVNDIVIDPRNPERVLLATDRGGVLAGDDGFAKYAASNHGFAHRTVGAMLADRSDPDRLYVGVVNDKELGGFFISSDEGKSWKLWNKGLNERDVFALQQTASGVIFAGTNHGIFYLKSQTSTWEPASMYRAPSAALAKTQSSMRLSSRTSRPRSTSARSSPRASASKPAANVTHAAPIPIAIAPRVHALLIDGNLWYAATNEGLFVSSDEGKKWYGQPVGDEQDLLALQQTGTGALIIASSKRARISNDGGKTWIDLALPTYVTLLYDMGSAPDSSLWLSTREGALRSKDSGRSWEHVLGGLPSREVLSVHYDAEEQKLLATALHSPNVYESADAGKSWHESRESIVAIRAAIGYQGRILAATAHNGLLLENPEFQPVSAKDSGNTGAEDGSKR